MASFCQPQTWYLKFKCNLHFLINEYNLQGFFNELTARRDASFIYSAIDGLIDRFMDWLND